MDQHHSTSKKIITTGLLVAGVIGVAVITTLLLTHLKPDKLIPNNNPSGHIVSTDDPAEIAKQADTLRASQPQEAKKKYEQAAGLYKKQGKTHEAADMLANAALMESTIKTRNMTPEKTPESTGEGDSSGKN